MGYTNGSYAYYATIAAASRGGYGAASSTWVEVGAGERMLVTGLRSLYELLGKLSDAPPNPKLTHTAARSWDRAGTRAGQADNSRARPQPRATPLPRNT